MASAEKQEQTESEKEDIISKIIGDFGKWQLTFTFLLSLYNLPCTWHIYALTFQGPEVDFWCAPPPNLYGLPIDTWKNLSQVPSGDKMDACKIWDVDYSLYTVDSIIGHNFKDEGAAIRDCKAWNYQQDVESETLVSQWNLVCSRSTLLNTAGTMFLAGVAFGGLTGFLSDRFGRKKTLMFCTLLQMVIGVLIIFVPWFELFLALRFILGFVSVSIVFSGFVLCMELVGGKWRTISGVCYMFPVAVGYITSAGISYLIRDWKYNQLAITLPSILLLALYWVLPESPRWLLTMGRTEETMEIVKEACRVNGRTIPANLDKVLQQSSNSVSNPEGEGKAGIADLFRFPVIRKKSILLSIIWFSVYFAYYGLVMNMSSFHGDIYTNTVVSGFVEFPSLALSIIILLKLGRRYPMGLTMILSGAVCLTASFFDKSQSQLTFGLAMVSRALIACSNMIMPVYTAELFPTVVRNLGVGTCNMSGGAAMVLVPFLWQLAVYAAGLPMGLLGACGIIGGSVALLLPETANQPMINTLDEGEEWGRKLQAMKELPKTKPSIENGNFNQTFSE